MCITMPELPELYEDIWGKILEATSRNAETVHYFDFYRLQATIAELSRGITG